MLIQANLILYQGSGFINIYCPEIHFFSNGPTELEAKCAFFASYPIDLAAMQIDGILTNHLLEAGWKKKGRSLIPPKFSALAAKKRLNEFLKKEARIVAQVKHPIALPIYEENNRSHERAIGSLSKKKGI